MMLLTAMLLLRRWRPAAAISNRYRLLTRPSAATCCTLRQRSLGGTDRRMVTIPLHRPCCVVCEQCLVSSVAGRRPLQSANTRTLHVPWTHTAVDARNFAVAGPHVWNSLPPELRMLNCSVCTFAAKLKTFLFSAVSMSENFSSRAISICTLHYITNVYSI